MRVSTFGKWEEQRKILVKDLANDPAIQAKTNEDTINNVLLNEVHADMFQQSELYKQSRLMYLPVKDLKEMIRGSYQEELSVMLRSLAKHLNISISILSPHVEKFCNNAMDATLPIIEDIQKINKLSKDVKNEAVDKLYGADFRGRYDYLAHAVMDQDEELISLVKSKMLERIRQLYPGPKEVVLLEHLKYSDEIARLRRTVTDFEQKFTNATGKGMQDYKCDTQRKAAADDDRTRAALLELSFLVRSDTLTTNAQEDTSLHPSSNAP